MARMDEKTWKEAVDDAHSRPWWVDALIAEAKRARELEAKLVRSLGQSRAALARLSAGNFNSADEVEDIASAALKAMEDGT